MVNGIMGPLMATKAKKTNKGMVGLFLHSLDADKQIQWQGYVAGNPEPGWYLVQLIDWMVGQPSVQRLFKIEEMHTWLFYPTAEDMKYSWEHGTAREGGPYRKRPEKKS